MQHLQWSIEKMLYNFSKNIFNERGNIVNQLMRSTCQGHEVLEKHLNCIFERFKQTKWTILKSEILMKLNFKATVIIPQLLSSNLHTQFTQIKIITALLPVNN